MDQKQAKTIIKKLKKLINRHRYLYHVLDREEISEAALDSLKKELFDLEQKFPELITSDSPTQRVEGKPLKKFEKARHPVPMLSFNDAFSEKDMEDWQERISKLLTAKEREELDFYCELKIDGLAIELIYEKGIFKTGSTRGDGKIGEDVTQNLKTIEAIPLKLHKESSARQKLPDAIVVRGEVFIQKKDFVKLNKEQEKKGLPSYANPRNVAAGSIRQLDPKVTAKRKLDSFAYGLISDLGQETHEEIHKILRDLGFKTNPHNKYCKDLNEVFEFHRLWQKKREDLSYEIDGIVVQVNSDTIFKKLGIVGKAPRGAIAFKFALKQATTIIEDIKVQVGRTGALTPVAHLRPVQVGGVTISRATLHNEDEIKRLGVRIGDTVIVGRAGDVIPDIIKVLPDLRTGKEKAFHMPKHCPVCGSALIKRENEVVRRCPNPKCPAKKLRAFYHFVSRNAFDIEGIGPKIIEKLVDAGLVSDPADLFKLKIGDILPVGDLPCRKPKAFLQGFAEKSAKNIVESIQLRKKILLSRLIYALGIRNVGEETSVDLAEEFGSLGSLGKAKIEELEKVKDIGPIVARSIFNWFQEKRNIEFLKKLKDAGIKIEAAPIKKKSQKLQGLTFVLTGSLEKMSRDEAKEKIRSFGGEISESASSKTDYAVVGKDPGTKYQKAKKLGVKTINEQEFLKIIK